jgi:hypothetical protein
MQNKLKVMILTASAVCSVALLGMSLVGGAATAAPPSVPNTLEVAAIQQAIMNMRAVTSEAYFQLDPSRLSSIYTNDARGGTLSDVQLKRVREEWKALADPRLANPAITPGYLDYQLAQLGWLKRGIERREALQHKAANEGRWLTDQEQRSLLDSNGQLPPARPERPSEPLPQPVFEAITINGDTAIAIVDGGPITSQFTLVRLNGAWMVAGEKILSVHV